MSEERDMMNSMKRSLNRFKTDDKFAMAIKRCTAELLCVCDDMEDCSDALSMIIFMVKENWHIVGKAASQTRSQK